MDGEFPWVLFGVFLLWVFRMLGGRAGAKVERLPRGPGSPSHTERPALPESGSTQTEGAQLEDLLRALERQLNPTAADPPRPRPLPKPVPRGPLGRPAAARLPEAEDLEERDSLEAEPVVESLEREVRRPQRAATNRLAQAEAKEQARLVAVEARDREPHKSRHATFDKRIRTEAVPAPVSRRFTAEQIRQAFVWGEILGRPKGDF
jgi:hypothetical protein